jgi:hypothetical protein
LQPARVAVHQRPSREAMVISYWIMVGPDGLEMGFTTDRAHYYVKVRSRD